MKSLRRFPFFAIALFAAIAAAAPALADVPGRVGRVAYVSGDVQSYSDSDPNWRAAYVNQPVTSRNSVFTGDHGRAEISVGSTALALDADTQVDIQQLDDNSFNANVVHGRVVMRVHRFDAGDTYNVAVPGADFALLKPGRYRIDAAPEGAGITVFTGQASAQTANGVVPVNAGNALRASSNPSDPNAAVAFSFSAAASTSLDDWVVARDERYREGQSARYVSPRMTGYEDLDANGRWASDADYGPVWYPTTYVRADWVPYRYGRWAYVAPWGYTWVDDAPWGFAPFHYGRWIEVGGRWGWSPGAYIAQPVYAPALVGFYGGSHFSASFSFGGGYAAVPAVGWYPLAPWQRYSPHYTQNVTYINQVNNITIVNPPARIARERGSQDLNNFRGGTIAPERAFASQQSISRVAMAAPQNLVNTAPPVAANALPRPQALPVSARVDAGNRPAVARPEFQNPREFATRPAQEARFGPGRAVEREAARDPRPPGVANVPAPAATAGAASAPQQAVQTVGQPPVARERILPPNYRRAQEGDAARAGAVVQQAVPSSVNGGQPVAGQAVPGQPVRPAQIQRGPNAPNFNVRPMPAQLPPVAQPDAARVAPARERAPEAHGMQPQRGQFSPQVDPRAVRAEPQRHDVRPPQAPLPPQQIERPAVAPQPQVPQTQIAPPQRAQAPRPQRIERPVEGQRGEGPGIEGPRGESRGEGPGRVRQER